MVHASDGLHLPLDRAMAPGLAVRFLAKTFKATSRSSARAGPCKTAPCLLRPVSRATDTPLTGSSRQLPTLPQRWSVGGQQKPDSAAFGPRGRLLILRLLLDTPFGQWAAEQCDERIRP